MGWPKEDNSSDKNPDEGAPRSRSRSVGKTLGTDFKPTKKGSTRNPFINFLLEFKKITPTLKLRRAEFAKIAGEMWRDMTSEQKARFQITEGRRRRRKSGGRRRRRRRRSRRGHDESN